MSLNVQQIEKQPELVCAISMQKLNSKKKGREDEKLKISYIQIDCDLK